MEITVVDEGVGCDTGRPAPPSGKRFGLAQLRERVRAAGGTLEVDAVIGAARLTMPDLDPFMAGSEQAAYDFHGRIDATNSILARQ